MRYLALVLVVTACQTSTRANDELTGATAQGHAFFEALGRSDCATLGAMVPAANSPAACDKFLHEWREDLKLELVDITDVRRDGRDKHAIIVTTTVKRHGEPKTMLFRATHEAGAWQLSL